MTDYYATQDPRVTHVVSLLTEAVKTAARERYADDFRAALDASAEAQSKAQMAIYELAEALVADGAVS